MTHVCITGQMRADMLTHHMVDAESRIADSSSTVGVLRICF